MPHLLMRIVKFNDGITRKRQGVKAYAYKHSNLSVVISVKLF